MNHAQHTAQLWHDAPAAGDWNRAFPAGNGRLGAMVFGEIDEERIALNDDTLYSGGPRDRINPDALPNLEKIRELVFAGKLAEATAMQREALTGLPPIMRHYEPLGDLLVSQRYPAAAYPGQGEIDVDEQAIAHGKADVARFSGYRRTLDLQQAAVTTRFDVDGVTYTRELFASRPDDAIVLRFAASKPGMLNLQCRLERGDASQYATRYFDTLAAHGGDTLVFQGQTGSSEPIGFAGGLRVAAVGGEVRTLGESVLVQGADEVVLYVTGATTERVTDPAASVQETLKAAPAWEEAVQRHESDYAPLYQAMSLDLQGADRGGDLPTDKRIERARDGGSDLGLELLYFNFARYLLIACSRPGTRAANLQGIWNDSFSPSWGSKYTININIQMNYWIAEVCGLSACHEPLFDLVAGIHKTGQETAQRMYGARGFVCHHNTDNTFDTCPTDRNNAASYWVMGGAWLALHLWEHYQFTRDDAFLRRVYPILHDATLFFVDFLVEDAEGRLVTCPSVSPENAYIAPGGEVGTICAGPTMDSAIIRELTEATLAAALVLGEAAPSVFQTILDKLPPLQIGKHGQLMEWADDLDEVEPGHRHISHLFALHPGSQIDTVDSPELAEAARVTLARRLASGGGHTGWSRAWITLFYCRLRDGENAHANLRSLLTHCTLPNLFDDHPPFQIDGNFGGAAAVTEMLIQSHHGRIDLLPALPAAWPQGEARGLRVRGGAAVDIVWEAGKPKQVTIAATHAGTFTLRFEDAEQTVELQAGQTQTLAW